MSVNNRRYMMKICTIIGTRPEIIKMAPIIRVCEKKDLQNIIIHTGQHYNFNMDKIFFEELRLPNPHYNLNIGSGTQGEQTSKIISRVEKALLDEKPDVILVQGDTNTVLGASLAAVKLNIKIGHVEAGLRSFDRNMPEEINRVLTDHIASYLYSPTIVASKNLINEGISQDNIFLTGNTIVDAIFQHTKYAKEIELPFPLKGDYLLVTIHRAENVDDPERLKNILSGLRKISSLYSYEIILPIHPRTKNMIEKNHISTGTINIIEPLGYLPFLKLLMMAKLVLTDSGGVQEESCILGVPCITLRENTERPETIEVGANVLVGFNQEKIISAVPHMLNKKREWDNPFGDGRSGEKIINHLIQNYS